MAPKKKVAGLIVANQAGQGQPCAARWSRFGSARRQHHGSSARRTTPPPKVSVGRSFQLGITVYEDRSFTFITKTHQRRSSS